MNPTQRAWAYVSRKRLRSLILFLILFVLLAGISACLTLMKSNKTVENNLYRSLNTSFSIKRIEADQTFQLSQLDDLKKIKGLEEISPELETIAKLTDKEVVTGEQSIQRDDLTEAEKNLISLIALEDSSKDVSFTSSAFTLKEGRPIEKGDRKKILVHEELAKKNNLKLGDKISLNPAQVEGNRGQNQDYEIVGIFSGQKQEKFTGLSSDFSENTVYTDYESSQTLLGNKEAQVTAARFYLENPKDMDSIIQEVEKLSLETKGYQVEKENKAFEQIKDSVSTFQTFLQIFLYGIMIAGVGALILVLSLWLRERVYEVGVLLALGKGKIAIFSQFCLEVIIVSLASILPAFVAGNAITSYLLKTVLASGDQAALQDTLAKATNLSTSLLSFGESYIFLLIISCLSVAKGEIMTLLQLQDLTYRYKNTAEAVLYKINYDFEPGKFYSIIGESGAGKSTLLSLLAGLDSPVEGAILFEGKDIREQGYSYHRMHHISLVFQNYNLIDYLSPLENIRLVNKKASKDTLLELGLDESQIKRNVLQLSGGQQQRVAIARSLVSEAPVILADEPTGNLDPKTAGDIIDLLKSLAEKTGKCVIVVTHSKEVAQASDITLELKDKKLTETRKNSN